MHKYKRWLGVIVVLLLLSVCVQPISVVSAQHGSITGAVTAPDGSLPPAGTKVRLSEPGDWETYAQADVQPDGSFSFGWVPQGLYVLRAIPLSASGMTQSMPLPVSIAGYSVDVGTLSLTNPEVSGTVLTPNGASATPAEVWVHAADGLVVQVLWAPDGTFLVGGLPVGTYGLVASPTSSHPYWKSPVVSLTLNGTSQVIDIPLRDADIYGTVTDPQGNPVKDAIVRAHPVYSGDVGTFYYHHDTTNAQGYYTIGGLVDGDYAVRATPPFERGSLLPSEPVTVTTSAIPQQADLELISVPKVLSGSVTTQTGDPVAYAEIIANRLDKNGQASTESALDGTYSLDLSEGLWSVTVQSGAATIPQDWVYPKPPQIIVFQQNREAESRVQDFTVYVADASVTGSVSLPGGADPEFDVTVALYNDEGVGQRTVLSSTTGYNFEVEVPSGAYKVWVKVDSPDYLAPAVDPLTVLSGETLDIGAIELLARDATVSGTVLDELGNRAAYVPVVGWRPGAPGGADAITNASGEYLMAVTEGEWAVRPALNDGAGYIYTGTASLVTLTSGQAAVDVDFEVLVADATILGYLVDDANQVVTDAEGWATARSSGETITGSPIEAGAFTLTVPAGTYNVAINLPAGSAYLSTGEKAVSVTSGMTETVTLDVTDKDAKIVGGLWDPRAELVVTGVDAAVLAWSGDNWARDRVNTSNGLYSLDVAAGLWHLGYRVDPDSDYVGARNIKHVPVQSEQTVLVGLPVLERDSTLSGTVLTAGGDPLPGATIHVEGAGPTVDNVHMSVISEADGTFEFELPHGDYHLGATVGLTDTLKPAIVHVQVPANGASTGHILQFREPDAVISGTITIDSLEPITGTVKLWAWSEDDAFVKTQVAVVNSTGSYSLDVISGTTWHVGAVYETSMAYYAARDQVFVDEVAESLDLTLTGPIAKPAPVAVTFDTAAPQRLELADGTHIYIPGGAIPATGEVTLRIVPIAYVPNQRNANIYQYGYAFTIVDDQGQPVTARFNQDVLIGFHYNRAELWRKGLNENTLKPAYFSTTTNSWTFPESYVIDTEYNVVMMQVDHFTDYGLTADALNIVLLPMVLH